MSPLTRAVLYRLFAGHGRSLPQHRLHVRLGLFGIGLACITWLLHTVTPQAALAYSRLQLTALMMVCTGCMTAVIYVLASAPQRSFLERLHILNYLPVDARQRRCYQLLAYMPLQGIVLAIALSVQAAFFGGSLHPWLLYPVVAGGSLLSGSLAMLLHTSRSRLRPYASGILLLLGGAALVIGWGLIVPGADQWLYIDSAVVFAVIQAGLVVRLLRGGPERTYGQYAHRVRQHRPTGLFSGLAIRASRTGRYIGANVTLAVLITALSVLAGARPAVMPFAGVLAIALLLGGTFGQEARSLSRAPLAFELVRYSRLGKWVLATWAVAFINVAIFTDVIVSVGLLWFPHSAQPGHAQVICMAACLTAAACCAGSLVVPHIYDMLAQLLSTALYGGMAWVVFRILQDGARLWLTCAVVGMLLAVAYVCEFIRWRVVTRGRHLYARA